MHPRIAALVAAAALAAACRTAPRAGGNGEALRLLPVLPEEEEVPARSAADVAAARRGRELLDAWSARVERPQGRVLLAAVGAPGGEADRVVRVADARAWPADTLVSYVLLVDRRGRLRLLHESPASGSGAWSLVQEHLFDETGTTLAFRRTSGFLDSGCGEEPTRESSTSFFGPGPRLARREYRLADAASRRLDPKACAFPHRQPYEIHADARSLLAALGLEEAARDAGVALAPSPEPEGR